jgi:hypothetical protein
MKAETIAKALGGRRSGGQWMARCVCHDDKMPSLALREGEGARLLVHCFAGCDWRDILVELKRRGLLDHDGREDQRKDCDRRDNNKRQSTSHHGRTIADRAMDIFSKAAPLPGSLAEHYLTGRGLVPELLDHDAVRSSPTFVTLEGARAAVHTLEARRYRPSGQDLSQGLDTEGRGRAAR